MCIIKSVLKRHDTFVGGEKMNKAKLRSLMTLHGDNNRDLAHYLCITEQSLSAKINEKGTEFKQGEMRMIKERYNLSPSEFDAIFFAD
jgi:hypothetical protein